MSKSTTIISEGFTVKYEVLKIGAIRPGAAGDFNGRPYGASVKFRSTLVTQRENEAVGIQEIETIVEFNIPCATNSEAVHLTELIRNARSNNDVIYVDGPLPMKSVDGDIYSVKTFTTAADLLKSSAPKKTA